MAVEEQYCGGIEPRLAQSRVLIMAVLDDGTIGIAITPKKKAE